MASQAVEQALTSTFMASMGIPPMNMGLGGGFTDNGVNSVDSRVNQTFGAGWSVATGQGTKSSASSDTPMAGLSALLSNPLVLGGVVLVVLLLIKKG